MISLYLHIPFCRQKCKYCSFYSLAEKKSGYTCALVKSIEYYGKRLFKKVKTVYIGGGTPSLLEKNELYKIMDAVFENFDVSEDAEITVECNPESLSEEFLLAAKDCKINRISIGIQSFDDKELSAVGRLHNAHQARTAIALAKEYGFENISCDLIFGLPYQTVESLEKNLEILVNSDIPHISCYNLQVEKGTPLYDMKLPIANEQLQEKMYYTVCRRLEDAGYEHYEISNFAKKGFESRHNSTYWTGEDYLGLGPGAHSKLSDFRCSFDADIEKFICKTDFEFDKKERIEDALFEKIMLGLRTKKGAELCLMPKSKGYIDMLCKNGFARCEDGKLILTDRGFYLSNTIISDITAKEC